MKVVGCDLHTRYQQVADGPSLRFRRGRGSLSSFGRVGQPPPSRLDTIDSAGHNQWSVPPQTLSPPSGTGRAFRGSPFVISIADVCL
jgi:hypothetical protein